MAGVGLPADDADLTPLFEAIVDTIPPPLGDPDALLQALVTNLDASDYLGRLAIGRVVQGTLRLGHSVALCKDPSDGGPAVVKRKLTQLMGFDGISRVDVESRGAGDLFVIAGFPESSVGFTPTESPTETMSTPARSAMRAI